MVRFVLTIISSLLLLLSPSAFAQSMSWTISELAGTVVVKTATAATPARKGGQVPPGAVLSTGAGSRAVLVRGKDFMTVNANGRVRIPTAGDKGFGLFDVLQEWGNAVFQIEKQPDPHFSVRTRYLAAVVKGTTFSITVSDQGASLQVVEGAVDTSTVDGGAHELITPGVVAVVEAADRMRLTVQDQQTRIIDSPARTETPVRSDSTSGAASPAPEPAQEPAAPASDSQPEAAVAPELLDAPLNAPAASSTTIGMTENEPQVLTEVITAAPTNLGATTDGFVSGTVVAQVASADVAVLRNELGGNGTVADNGKADDNGNSTDHDDDDDKGASANNGNAGGNGNSSDHDDDDDKGSSANNGNAGGNGNSNDHDDDDDKGSSANYGNAGGNGNSSDHDDDDDKGSSANNGNAGGNGNSSDHDDDDDKGSSANNGNAGGNGNSNSADNGNAGGNDDNAAGDVNARGARTVRGFNFREALQNLISAAANSNFGGNGNGGRNF
ncbi:FecR domain-containing protein [Novosphingobium sp.]|uniref:FecR domain-containing protein n=1 Tax=Novosphingobium sp. TaxID=1874826 RepID=UPI002602A86B|nr:FecR domain-containing protein [Novosphingobium sp.]